MHEMQRRAYLDAMGIVCYVPRFVLPNAAPSKLCIIPVPQRGVDDDEPGERKAQLELKKPTADRAGQATSAPRPEMPVFAEDTGLGRASNKKGIVEEKAPIKAVVEFTAYLVGSALGIAFVTDQNMAAADKRLLANIATAYSRHACGSQDSGLQAGQFRWPVARSNSLNQDAEAARDAFSAHILARAERESLRGLVVFGDGLQTYLDARLLKDEGLGLIATVELSELAGNAAAKAALWRDLKGLPR